MSCSTDTVSSLSSSTHNTTEEAHTENEGFINTERINSTSVSSNIDSLKCASEGPEFVNESEYYGEDENELVRIRNIILM